MRHILTRHHPAVIALIALLGASLGCNLGAGNNSVPTQTPSLPPLPTITLFPTQTLVVLTPTPVATAYIPPTAVPVATLTNCTPYAQWPLYYVQAGDTLGAIAQRTGTTLQQLMTANCLTNSNLIYVGQPLRVPSQPVTPTPVKSATPGALPTQPNGPAWNGVLTVAQVWPNTAGGMITYYAAVRLSVGEVYNAVAVDFYVNDPSGGTPILAGTDVDPWDGAFVDYSFPAPGAYTFQATARNEIVSAKSTIVTVTYNPNFIPPDGRQYNTLTVTPNLGTSGGWITLARGARVTIAWPDVPGGAVRVDFTLTPTGTGTTPQTIGSDAAPSDGAGFTWTVPGGLSGYLQAIATLPNGQTISSELANIYVP